MSWLEPEWAKDFPPNSQIQGEHLIQFSLNGVLHREPLNGPARMRAGTWFSEEYYWNGVLHRANGPAVSGWVRDVGGSARLLYERYVWCGYCHRETSEGPAERERVVEGLYLEQYWLGGVKYRDPDEGPDRIEWDETGSKIELFPEKRRNLVKLRERMARRERWFLRRKLGTIKGSSVPGP
jgi:hypothetical protein